jgi:hypothetical protein
MTRWLGGSMATWIQRISTADVLSLAEKEIEYGPYGGSANARRSRACKELRRRGVEAFSAVDQRRLALENSRTKTAQKVCDGLSALKVWMSF